MDYPYEQLDPERFQTLCQALLAKEHKNVQCFPVAQPDGGRDAMGFIEDRSKDREFLVYQVKFVRQPQEINDLRLWLLEIIRGELPKLTNLIPRGAKQYVLITNVAGTAHLGSGSIDKVQALLDTLPVPSICWWRDDINRRLDTSWDLKWIYPELMTGPDLLRAIVEHGLNEDQQRRTAAISAFIHDQYAKDAEVRFKQVELHNQLLHLFIDVPICFTPSRIPRQQRQALASVLYSVLENLAAEGILRPESTRAIFLPEDHAYYLPQRDEDRGLGAATLLLHFATQQHVRRLVIEGAPGQGKSTIAQYVCQVHRMQILRADLSVLPEHHRKCPVRIPFRVDLRDLAAWLEKKDPFSASDEELVPIYWHRSLESFLAAQVRYHSGGIEFSPTDLAALARISPILLVFDGLDEVAQMKRRQEVVSEISDGVRRLETNASSLQVIVTSRPAAFANSPTLPLDTFDYLDLASLTRPLIDEYTDKWIKARKLPPPDARDVRRILKDKLDAPHLRDLARNPMQLAILLSLIHTRGASLPDKRTALYDSYVDLFFNREAEKSVVVREHRDLLIHIHRFLAWTLHAQAEAGQSGSIRSDDLEKLLGRYLRDEGYDASLVQELFTGMVERVVAIVSRVQGTYEFEVQPLREYFAARYLYETAPYSPPGAERQGTKLDRFRAISRNFYWLNVTRFYAGCYSVGELPSLVSGLEDLTESVEFLHLSHPRILSAMLLSDWVFAQHPKSVRQVVRLILDAIGMRFVLAASSRTYGASNPLVLPSACGREELLDYAMEILTRNPPRDFAYDIIELINQNSGGSDVYKIWMHQILKRKGAMRARWMEFGLWLGIITNLDESELSRIVSDQSLDGVRIRILLRGHQAAWLAADEERVKKAAEAVLCRVVRGVSVMRGDHVLEAFTATLDPLAYFGAATSGYTGPLSKWTVRRGFVGLANYEASQVELDATLSACEKVVLSAKEQLERPAVEWNTLLAPWSAIVEAARNHWGDQPALFHFSSVAAGIRSTSEQCSGARDLFDESVALCQRVRYARLRAGAPQWWKGQVSRIKTENHGLLATEVLLMWGSVATVSQLLADLDAVLKDLSKTSWDQIYESLSEYVSVMGAQNWASHSFADFSELPKGLSPRTLTVIGLRCESNKQSEFYDAWLKGYKGKDTSVLQFCQSLALGRALSGQSDWLEHLDIVERCYTLGASLDRYAHHRIGHRFSRPGLSATVASAIASKPDRYPAILISMAESALRSQMGENVTAVVEIAKKEKWFM